MSWRWVQRLKAGALRAGRDMVLLQVRQLNRHPAAKLGGGTVQVRRPVTWNRQGFPSHTARPLGATMLRT